MAWCVIGELFPLRTRAKQASLATAGNWFGNFLISFLTPLADDGISYAYGFVFAGCNLAGALLVWFFLYESKGLSLENVDRMYSDPNVKPYSSSKWVPPGYITRKQKDDSAFHRASTTTEATAVGDGQHKEKSGDERPYSEHHHMKTGPTSNAV